MLQLKINTKEKGNSSMNETLNKSEVIYEVTNRCVQEIKENQCCSVPCEIARYILEKMQYEIAYYNHVNHTRWRMPEELSAHQIAILLVEFHQVRAIEISSLDYDKHIVFGVYQFEGPQEGLYCVDENVLKDLVSAYYWGISQSEYRAVLKFMEREAEKRIGVLSVCTCSNFIPVCNGIFDYDTKQLLPFTPDLVFFHKSPVAYQEYVTPVFVQEDGTVFDVEVWMSGLSKHQDVVQTLWQVLGASLRTNQRWSRMICLYADHPRSGRGLFCKVLQQLCGSWKDISLCAFDNKYGLSELPYVSAVISREQDSKLRKKRESLLKELVCGDLVAIHEWSKAPYYYGYSGLIAECVSDMTEVKSDALARRQLYLFFEETFTESDLVFVNECLKQPEVLEYILHKVLYMEYEDFTVPLYRPDGMFVSDKDSVTEFVNDIFPKLQWDLVPFTFLYDLYKAWYQKQTKKRVTMTRNKFLGLIVDAANTDGTFVCTDKSKQYRTTGRMDKPEPLIAEYELVEWMNPMAMGSRDVRKQCCPVVRATQRGLIRK